MHDSVMFSQVADLATVCRFAYHRAPLSGYFSDSYDHFFVSVANAQAVVVYNDSEMIVAVAGSDQAEDWNDNFDAGLRPLVGTSWSAHRGFTAHANDLWRRLGPRLDDLAPNRSIVFVGHSLGGAVAILLAQWLKQAGHRIDDIVTFGSPRVFDYRGAAVSRMPLLRVCNSGDPVPHLPTPWRFAHFGDKWYLTERGSVRAADPLAWIKSLWWMIRRFVSSGGVAAFDAHSIETYEKRLDLAADLARQAEAEQESLDDF